LEYYDTTNDGNVSYYDIIEKPVRSMRMKIELLDHFENCIDSIEQDIDSSSAGSIVVNNEQGCQRSCSFTLINVDEKYTIDENNFFWFNRKFKLYLGLTDYTNTFWFTKGVFITSSANCDSVAHTVDISGVDKYAQLNGDLNVLQADEMDTVFEIGTNIEECVKSILMLDLGNGFVLDPIEPLIDPDIAKQCLYKEFTMSAGSYFGDFFTEIATCFGCDIFYDALGRLVITRVFNDDIPYWYAFKSPAHKFDSNIHGYIAPSLSTDMKGVNKIIVSTDNTETENAQYTAINHNPRSPLCYDKIGARTLAENGGVITINAGDPSEGSVEKRCKDYAEYRMLKETCLALKVHFNTIPYLHLNRGDVIVITDPQFNLDGDGFIIDSITYPLDTGEISIEATNLKYLNTDIYIDSLYTEKREIVYSVSYDTNGGTGFVPSTLVSSNDETFVVSRGYDEENRLDDFSKEGYEFTYWTDKDDNIYYANSTHENPHSNLKLKANWASTANRVFKMSIRNCPSKRLYYVYRIIQNYSPLAVDKTVIDGKTYYTMGKGYNAAMLSVNQTVEGDFEVENYTTEGTYSAYLDTYLTNVYSGYVYSLSYPNVINEINLYYSAMSNKNGLNYIYYPKYLASFLTRVGTGNSANAFYNLPDCKQIVFSEIPLTVSAYSPSSNNASNHAYFIYHCESLEKVWFKHNLTINNTASSNGYMVMSNIHANIIINGDFTMNNCYVYCSFINESEDENTIDISGKLTTQTARDSFYCGTTSPNTIVKIGSVENTGGMFSTGSAKSVEITGQTVNGVGASMFNGSSVGSVLRIGTLINSGGFGAGISGTEEIVIKGFLVHNAQASYTICGNADLRILRVTDFVYIAPTNNTNFICGNTSLTDIYFYSDNITISDDTYIDKLFVGNNANLKIHGIADGAVQALAERLGIQFVALTEAEIEEAGDL